MSDQIILLTSCFLEGNDDRGNNRFQRNMKYLKWYSSIRNHLFFDMFYLGDNASDPMLVDEVLKSSQEINRPIAFQRFDTRLTGGSKPYDYPYCWRALAWMAQLTTSPYLEKIIFIDSDGFILTEKLTKYVNSFQSGWTAFWCQKYGFAESAFHVLCKDSFPVLRNFVGMSPDSFVQRMNGKCMETTLPFTQICREFNTDRFGEDRKLQMPSMDYYGQAPLEISSTFQFQLDH